ncbi:MAG: type II toxin-antitoxin system RelE/ParE family toxin [archaeon]
MYAVKMTTVFEKKFRKIIPRALHEQTLSRIRKLSRNPFVGKPLGDRHIRELKVGKFRIYFLIFDAEVIVLLTDIGDKKNQQEIIDFIKGQRAQYEKCVKNLKESDCI